jgi:hypothetical protein
VTLRTSSAVSLLTLALFCTGCSSEPTAAAGAHAIPGVTLRTGTDAGGMADLQASDEWNKPSCRWLETGVWVLAYRQETAIYEAARDLGYIEMSQAGTANRIGTPEPAWKVSLTDAGKAESEKCGSGSSRSEVFGVPVSQRRFISGKRIKEPDMYNPDRTVFEVEFEWVPTAAGDRVKYVLTDKMSVQQGVASANVSLKYGERVTSKGGNGWWVEQIHDISGARR